MQFAIPSIIAMVLTSLITIVDGYFVGNHVGEKGLTAVNLGLPIIYLFLAVGIMVGVGGVSIAGRLLGSKQTVEANQVYNQTLWTSFFASIALSLAVFLMLHGILTVVPLDILVVSYMKDYYDIMLIAFPIMMLNSVFGMFIRAEGKPQIFMMLNTSAVIVNIILDYILIDLLGFGIAGAAYASLIAILLATIMFILYFVNKSVCFKFMKFRFSKSVYKETMLNGSSEFIGQISLSISMLAYNAMIINIAGIKGVAAFTVVGYTAYIFSMVIMGFGQGASPIISYTYGADDPLLSIRIRRITNIYVAVAGLVAFMLMQVGASAYSETFVKDVQVQDAILTGVKIFVFSFLLSGINVITSFYFTSIGYAKESALISASRGLVVLLICIFVLPQFFGMIGIWLVAPVTEGITFVLVLILIRKEQEIFKDFII